MNKWIHVGDEYRRGGFRITGSPFRNDYGYVGDRWVLRLEGMRVDSFRRLHDAKAKADAITKATP